MRWYAVNKRPLPWRRTLNPYRILVAEIMSHQTQVSRVARKYGPFLRRFPTLQSLVREPVAGLIRSWQGMGYNGRAVRLRESAVQIAKNHGGRVPEDLKVLQTLPGIGKYTAHAIACFAFAQRVPVVDVNVHRVLSRIFWKMKSVRDTKDAETVWNVAHDILPKSGVQKWNQALMDLGATVCTSQRPVCGVCPVRTLCSSTHILSHSNRMARRKPSREPLYHGLPVRIYRGRIVERLRRLNGRTTIALNKLGREIKADFARSEFSWLESVLRKLAKDGLVEFQKRRNTTVVRLPEHAKEP